MRRCVAALLLTLLSWPVAAQPQDAPPPGWETAWDYMVESVCVDARNKPLIGVSPLDGPARCARSRKIGFDEILPYRRRDWPGAEDQMRYPDGYLQMDSVPTRSSMGPAIVQAVSFGDEPRRFDQFAEGDGGQVVFFDANYASIGLTEDGGGGLQFFLGPNCTPIDAWVLVDAAFPRQPSGEMVARITRRPDACASRMGYAFTRWWMQPVAFRDKVGGVIGRITLNALVTDHFGGRSVDSANNLERMYFTRELGYTRWERWQNFSRQDRSADRRMAANFARTGRCEPQVGPPSTDSEWVMVDCREWTQMVRPLAPGGDPPTFWLDRLRGYAETRAIFAR